LVGEGAPTKLAVLTSLDPIYAYFEVNELDVVAIRTAMKKNRYPGYRETEVPVFAAIAGDQGYPREVKLDFVATAIISGTGTLQMRGLFSNPKVGLHMPDILPGMFMRVRMPVGEITDAALVPDTAIGVNQAGRYVLVVDAAGIVHERTVTTGDLEEGRMRVVLTGLKADDRVVVDGLQRARPGSPVAAVESAPAGKAPSDQSPPPANQG